MNKSPLNHLLTFAFGAILWVIFGVFLVAYLSENPALTLKDPADLANELRIIFGVGTLLSIVSASYWYFYGNKESTAGELQAAKKKWLSIFIFQIILSVTLTGTIVGTNVTEGIEAKWFGIYYAINAVLTFLFFWLATFLMSPRTVKYIPLGK
ncbi:MAG: hypothetical protein IPK03_05480 [Bacteroidetes bacterium]|nr:hypothetical protein [Bacteroidota bacterium]